MCSKQPGETFTNVAPTVGIKILTMTTMKINATCEVAVHSIVYIYTMYKLYFEVTDCAPSSTIHVKNTMTGTC